MSLLQVDSPMKAISCSNLSILNTRGQLTLVSSWRSLLFSFFWLTDWRRSTQQLHMAMIRMLMQKSQSSREMAYVCNLAWSARAFIIATSQLNTPKELDMPVGLMRKKIYTLWLFFLVKRRPLSWAASMKKVPAALHQVHTHERFATCSGLNHQQYNQSAIRFLDSRKLALGHSIRVFKKSDVHLHHRRDLMTKTSAYWRFDTKSSTNVKM